jgi:hypothetical protein
MRHNNGLRAANGSLAEETLLVIVIGTGVSVIRRLSGTLHLLTVLHRLRDSSLCLHAATGRELSVAHSQSKRKVNQQFLPFCFSPSLSDQIRPAKKTFQHPMLPILSKP